MTRVVIDTNVLVSALRSRLGASFRVISAIGTAAFEICLSVALTLEYEEIAKRQARELGLTAGDIEDVIDYLCSVAHWQELFFLWRPMLSDPDDDMVLELAANAGCDFIVTHNVSDFAGAERFGVRAITPREFLRRLDIQP